MEKQVSDFINNHNAKNVIFVLKGFFTEQSKYDLSITISNKIKRLTEITLTNKNIISYDEFICMYDFIISQFTKIYILNNPVYYYFYPVGCEIPQNIKKILCQHFDNDNDSKNIITNCNLNDYTDIYNNFAYIQNNYVCCYNDTEHYLDNIKIHIVNIKLDSKEYIHNLEYTTQENKLFIISSYKDYYNLVCQLKNSNEKFSISFPNFTNNKDELLDHLKVLSEYYSKRIFIFKNDQIQSDQTKNRDDIYCILKRYWNYESFRLLKVYDLDKLNIGQIKIKQISQYKIIDDLITQIENSYYKKTFRNMFVTAPTGSGKSLMFQIPAMYIAEKYNLLTLVITPLIGLMQDQVKALKNHGYNKAKTINSDVSPIIKKEILDDVCNNKCDILYLSPESLLSRSDIEQLIGKREIGMIVIDEAHIVTTWGKQFRPDYWYLGDYIQKLRSRQSVSFPFITATFTATAIYKGTEDMYQETINSLNMGDPITYLGYIKRDNISIDVKRVETKTNKTEYELTKFDSIVDIINSSLLHSKKVLIYFPTITLINRFYDYCYTKDLSNYVVKYHGQLNAEDKKINDKLFRNGKKLIMLATKAFGMGIDIEDISTVVHFAPTGTVCDYVQEIGRAARDDNTHGHAVYYFMKNDFKYINRFYGLSTIKKYQLIQVIVKILELYETKIKIQNYGLPLNKQNGMLVDASSFSYIFNNPMQDENNTINMVKTAMLLIQKNAENRNFAPFHMRPIPMFTYGYFSLSKENQIEINKIFNCVHILDETQDICKIDLGNIWEQKYKTMFSFPQFKYFLYSKNEKLDLNIRWCFTPAIMINIDFYKYSRQTLSTIVSALKQITDESIIKNNYIDYKYILNNFTNNTQIHGYKAESIVNNIIASMGLYCRYYTKSLNSKIYRTRVDFKGNTLYHFISGINMFYSWITNGLNYIIDNTKDNKMYFVDNIKYSSKEIITLLGVFESIGCLKFDSSGGSDSQIYIYVNETKSMRMVKDKPSQYHNQLLKNIQIRHTESVKMLNYLFSSGFSSDKIWKIIEDYFLGILPDNLNN